MDIKKLRFPIDTYNPGEIQFEEIQKWIEDIKGLPEQLSSVLKGITDQQLEYTYRPDGWNIRQVVHHIADSHINALIRFKLALTEDNPTIKPYMEAKWALLDDVDNTPIEASLSIISGLHHRWVNLVKGMSILEYSRIYTHPEHGKSWDLAYTVGMYSWHGRHHLAHIENALKFEKVAWE